MRRRRRRRPLRRAGPWRWRKGAVPEAPVARLSRAAWVLLTTLSTMERALLRIAAGAPAEACLAGGRTGSSKRSHRTGLRHGEAAVQLQAGAAARNISAQAIVAGSSDTSPPYRYFAVHCPRGLVDKILRTVLFRWAWSACGTCCYWFAQDAEHSLVSQSARACPAVHALVSLAYFVANRFEKYGRIDCVLPHDMTEGVS